MIRKESKDRVFLVSGRNRGARSQLADLLQSFGLEVVDWETAIALTGTPAPHAREVLVAAMRSVKAVVVLFSGDEEARLRKEFCAEGELETEGRLQPQARPNVIFEAGLAFALFPKQTVVVQLGRLRTISDLAGVQYVPLDSSPESLLALANRLRAAGCALKVSPDRGIDLPPADTELPPVPKPAEAGGKIALFRRLKAFLPIPGIGGSVEVASSAHVGDVLTLSIELPGETKGFRVCRWLPGQAVPREVPLSGTHRTPDLLEVPLAISGPAGIHFFDLLVQPQGQDLFKAVARARCAVAEP